MSALQPGSEQPPAKPPASKGRKKPSSSPKRRRPSFGMIIRGIFPSSKPKIVPDDLDDLDSAETDAPASKARTAPAQDRAGSVGPTPLSAPTEGAKPGATNPENDAPQQTQTKGRQNLLNSLHKQLALATSLWIVLLVMVLVSVGVTLGIMFLSGASRIPSQEPSQQRGDKIPISLESTEQSPTAIPTGPEHRDDLHGFKVRNSRAEGWIAEATPQDCAGTVFARDAVGLKATAPDYPRLRICFLGFQLDHPGKSLNDYLDERLDSPFGRQVTNADRGLIKDYSIGTSKTSGLGAFLLGTDGENNHSDKWFVVAVNFEGRIYSIEAVAAQEDWDMNWPKMQRLIEQIEFETGVIRPAKTPIVIQ